MRYAMVDNGIAVNVILWDGESEFECEGELFALEGDSPVCPGWRREGDDWIAPPGGLDDGALEAELAIAAARGLALRELVAMGMSEETARTIIGIS